MEGAFSGFNGTVLFERNDLPNSKFDVVVDANTIKTANSTKDKYARGDNWFNAETYLKIKFASTSFNEEGNGFMVDGTLELHGAKNKLIFLLHLLIMAIRLCLLAGLN